MMTRVFLGGAVIVPIIYAMVFWKFFLARQLLNMILP
jgi:hypothetical protein